MTLFAPTSNETAFSGLRLRLPPFGRWFRVARERQALARLGERELRDMGIDPSAAALEASRPFWDVPAGR